MTCNLGLPWWFPTDFVGENECTKHNYFHPTIEKLICSDGIVALVGKLKKDCILQECVSQLRQNRDECYDIFYHGR